MSRFRKKPVVIEATQWFKNGDHPDDMSQLLSSGDEAPFLTEGHVVRYFCHPNVPGSSICQECVQPFAVHGWIDTKEDGHRVCPGDWIITGIQGERYPCKPSIFAATYEPVGEGEAR